MQWWDGEWCDAGIDGLVSPVAVALMPISSSWESSIISLTSCCSADADLELVGIKYNFALIAILKSS